MPVRWIPGSSFFGNSYLVGNVLVDAAVLPTQIEPFRSSIRTIVLTHCHFDHIAYVNEIAHMCNAEVCIHRLDARGLSDDAQSLSMNFGTRSPGRVPDRILEDGEMVGDLHVIHTPGHTPGSICLYKEDEKALMSGDTVFTDGGFGRFDFPGGSRIELARSIELLTSLDVDGLYPGHGSPVQHGGSRHIEGARALLKMSYV